MREISLSNKYFDKEMFVTEKCMLKVVISNDISKDWVYKKGVLMAVGFLYSDRINVFVAEKDNDTDFLDMVCNFAGEMSAQYSLQSFNAEMAREVIRANIGMDMIIKDMRPFKGKGWSLDKFYAELVGNNVIPDRGINDPIKEAECVECWQKFQEHRKFEYLRPVTEHIIASLLKMSAVYKNRRWFLENYRIDPEGWVR